MFTVNLPSANTAAIRADGYSASVFASFFKHKIIAQGTIVAPTYPQAGQNPIIIVDNYTTGAYTDLEYGMEVVFTDASGNYKGRTYVREAEISAPVFQIPEYAQAKLNLESGDIFTVYDEFRLHAKIVGARASFPPDLLEHTDEGSNPPPRILTGGAWAGRVDDGETFASVPFDYTESRNTDPDSTPTDVAFTTRTQTGVAPASGYTDTDDQIVLEIDASATAYTVTVEGEDTDNSKVTLRRTPVMVHDDDHPPHEVVITAYDGSQESGFNFTIEVVDGAVDIDTIPEGCLCVLWTDERYNGAWANYRNRAPGREHIIGVGYIRRETLAGDENGVSTMTFEVESYLSLLKSLTSYSKVMEENATPDAWSEVKTLGVIRAVLQLPMFYSNLLEVADVYVDSAVYNPRYPAFYLQRSNFYDQLKELLDGVDAVMSCDRAGRITIHTYPPFIPLADRASITKQWSFTASDALNWEGSSPHYDAVEQMKTSGFTGGTSGNVPLFSLYPGHAPGTGVDAPTRDRLIVVDQDDLNERTGRYGALADDVYMDADGLKWHATELRLTLRGGYNFLDFGKHFYDFTEGLRGWQRQLADYASFLFYLTAISWSAGESGEGETTATFRVATNAASAESYFPPPDESIPSTTLPTYPPITLPDLFPGSISRGAANMAVVCINNVYLTSNFYASYPTWASAYSKPWGGTLIEWVPSGFSPGYGWILTTTELGWLKLSDGTYVVKHTFSTSSTMRAIDASFAENGFVAVNSYYPSGGGTKCLHSTNNSSFSETTVNSYDGWPSAQVGMYVSSKVAGKIIVSALTTGNTTAAYVSTDHGATWGLLSPALVVSYGGYANIYSPFQGNPSDNIYYYATADGTNNDAFYRNSTDVTPQIAGANYTPFPSRRGMDASVANRLRMLVVGELEAGSFANVALFLTNNGGTSYSTIEQNTGFRRCAIAGNDQNRGWVWGSGVLKQVDISGSTATTSDRMGNLASLTPGEIIGLAGLG